MAKAKTYRLREIPAGLDRLDVAELLSKTFSDTGTKVDVISLTTMHHAEQPATKTATLMFDNLPSIVAANPGQGHWMINDVGLKQSLVLDTEFFGITLLNEVSDEKHQFE